MKLGLKSGGGGGGGGGGDGGDGGDGSYQRPPSWQTDALVIFTSSASCDISKSGSRAHQSVICFVGFSPWVHLHPSGGAPPGYAYELTCRTAMLS